MEMDNADLQALRDSIAKLDKQVALSLSHITSEHGTMERIERSLKESIKAVEDLLKKVCSTVYGNGRIGVVEDLGIINTRMEDVEKEIALIRKNTTSTNRALVLLVLSVIIEIGFFIFKST